MELQRGQADAGLVVELEAVQAVAVEAVTLAIVGAVPGLVLAAVLGLWALCPLLINIKHYKS